MIRLLTADDDAAYRVLWARAIGQHGEHFRTAPFEKTLPVLEELARAVAARRRG